MKNTSKSPITARRRLTIVGCIGLAVGAGLIMLGQARYAALAAWDAAALTYVGSVLMTLLPSSAQDTKAHARRENPGTAAADIILLIASLVSLGAVGFLIMQAGSATGGEKAIDITLSLVSVVVSWSVVHTNFMLKYARLYYGDPEGGIDFNEKDLPRYAEFAYLAFTLGMTFQVSDTDIQSKQIRTTVLRHAMLSYVFGTVIIATTINTLASLSS